MGTVLVDGYMRGTWKIVRERKTESAVLAVQPDSPLTVMDLAALEEEGEALLRFAADDAVSLDVQVVSNA